MAATDTENQVEQAMEKVTKNKSKPKKALPTDRAAVARQFDILRGYAAASGVERKPVSNEDVAKVVNIHSGSVSNCNPFFLDIGFISREKNGNVPAEEVFVFAERSQWNQEKAAHKLAPLIRKTWFCTTLLPKLAFRPLPLDQAVEFLADEAGAGPEYKDQLVALVEYMRVAGIVSVEGNTITIVKDHEDRTPESKPVGFGGGARAEDSTLIDKVKKRQDVESDMHHPFIAGLLKALPEPETEWAVAGRVKWLQAASNIFDLIYTAKEEEAADFVEVKRSSLA